MATVTNGNFSEALDHWRIDMPNDNLLMQRLNSFQVGRANRIINSYPDSRLLGLTPSVGRSPT
jgi:hypothetical protein